VAPEGAAEGTIFFHRLNGTYEQQAQELFERLLPEILERTPDLSLGEIAVLYPAAWLGDAVAEAATEAGVSIIRADRNAMYPRASRLMRWLEQCARWCCGGWCDSDPKFSVVASEGLRLFSEALLTEEKQLEFQRELIGFLWPRRDSNLSLHSWLLQFRNELLLDLFRETRTLGDEAGNLSELIEKTDEGTEFAEFSLGMFSGKGEAHDRVNLSTLHSSKGREFEVVIMFGIDRNGIPRRNSSPRDVMEARRLFYVGFTRAKNEVHLVTTRGRASPFVVELADRLRDEQ
jgi:DNA helicase-2/ATP-dependent DNA helicase PcrA